VKVFECVLPIAIKFELRRSYKRIKITNVATDCKTLLYIGLSGVKEDDFLVLLLLYSRKIYVFTAREKQDKRKRMSECKRKSE
jgi:hypothetical protein